MKTWHWLTILAMAALLGGGALLYWPAADDPAESRTAGSDELAQFRAGDLRLGVATEPPTPQVGDNTLVIEIARPDGTPLEDAAVSAIAEMPAMGAMPAMRAAADLQRTAPGRFQGTLSLSMRGEWPLTITVETPDGASRRLQFDLATGREGLDIAAGGRPVGGSAGSADEDSDGAINIDNRRRQLMGLETAEATHRDLTRRIRAVGRIAVNERRRSEVALKFDGYIGELAADFVGAPVERGQVLFTVYGPELLAAQQEYLDVLERRGQAGRDDPLLRAARERLRLWDMPESAIDALERRGTPSDYVPIHAPRSGTVLERNISAGAAAPRGRKLLEIADLSQVWIEADVYDADLELVAPGMTATVTLPYLPGRAYEADVEFVYPQLRDASRTGRIRLSLDNADGTLKPGMYADVDLHAEIGHRLAVPEEAVIVAGNTRVVFVDLGNGRLKPVRIRTGRRAEGYLEVLEGLSLGDRVVTSGNFLLAAETRLKTGLLQW
ncbi:MAG: efflux RND transporter periplasmic adaptor subunit [Gammaproteobacteria bacterium]|nr:efflux RND transporter periplasmic adaptor subunit [Gammaproteobacteria bacterium]